MQPAASRLNRGYTYHVDHDLDTGTIFTKWIFLGRKKGRYFFANAHSWSINLLEIRILTSPPRLKWDEELQRDERATTLLEDFPQIESFENDPQHWLHDGTKPFPFHGARIRIASSFE